MSDRTRGLAARTLGVVTGIAAMVVPAVVQVGSAAADIAYICGPIAAALCVVAISDVTVAVRWASLPVGIVLAGAAVLLGSMPGALVLVAAGLVIAGQALVHLPPKGRYAGGWRRVWNEWRAAAGAP